VDAKVARQYRSIKQNGEMFDRTCVEIFTDFKGAPLAAPAAGIPEACLRKPVYNINKATPAFSGTGPTGNKL
jgi:hypothetical protein